LGVLVFIDQEFTTFETHAFQNLGDLLDVLNEEHWAGHLNASEIPGGVDVRLAVRWTNHAWT
jgi:hypothetical protein